MGLYEKFEELYDNHESKKLDKKVKEVLALDSEFSKMSDDELKNLSIELQNRAKNGESESSLLPETFALVREATFRTLGIKQYPVQVKGGIALSEGNIAEMATGEGKTLVAPFAAFLHALKGENVHVITSNEYLAKRDSEQMSKLFGFLGMSVGLSLSSSNNQQKQQAYSCNITYTTNTELGFDYLRDNNAKDPSQKVLRGLNAVVIDEADDTLLDEASTPLIMSTLEKNDDYKKLIYAANKLVETFQDEIDYFIDEERQCALITEEGIKKVEKYFGIVKNDADYNPETSELFSEKFKPIIDVVNTAVKAHALLEKDVDYIIEDGKVQIVGAGTGRVLEGRQFGEGLHHAVEAKEHVYITDETKTVSRINFQNFFRLYDKVSGMTGTCKTDEDEIQKTYNLKVIKIETNKELKRVDNHFKLYDSIQARNQAMKDRILELHKQGRPILIGTSSVEKSVEMAEFLSTLGLDFNLLNATNDEEESKIIAQAGRLGTITIATNMAGRGTDIKLGGNPTFLAKEEMKKQGFSEQLISFADSHLSPTTETEKEARKTFVELENQYKKITEKEKKQVSKLGGLAVIGTELNSSRRVDNQLRGRAGRQGEEGSSDFYIAEPDIAETFAPYFDEEAYNKAIKKENKDGEITNKKAISLVESAQLASESILKKSRENMLGINEIEATQRTAVWQERNEILEADSLVCDPDIEIDDQARTYLEQYIKNLFQTEITNFVDNYYSIACEFGIMSDECKNAKEDLRKNVAKFRVNPAIITDEIINSSTSEELSQRLTTYVFKIFKCQTIECKQVFKNVDEQIKATILQNIDKTWADYLDIIDLEKSQINLNTGDSLVTTMNSYIKNTYYQFDKMKNIAREEIIDSLSNFLTQKSLVARQIKQKEKSTQNTNKKQAEKDD